MGQDSPAAWPQGAYCSPRNINTSPSVQGRTGVPISPPPRPPQQDMENDFGQDLWHMTGGYPHPRKNLELEAMGYPSPLTNTCENITFPDTSDKGGNNNKKQPIGLLHIFLKQQVIVSSMG